MPNYQIVGNIPPEQIFGSKRNVEIVLKGMNISKTIATRLGKEYNPPLVWNENLPEGFVVPLADYVTSHLEKDINWKPIEEDYDYLRKELAKVAV